MLIPPKFPEYPSVEDALWTSLRAAITGEATVEEGLARASREIRRIMKPAGRA
jgi:multiple sugar transport system substrate-binding protein